YTQNKPLIEAEATLDDKYFQDDIDPIIYQKYPSGTAYTVRRDINEWGFRPVKSLPLLTNYTTSAQYGVNLETLKTQFPYRYNLPYAYKTDHTDIRDRVLNAQIKGVIPADSNYLDILDS